MKTESLIKLLRLDNENNYFEEEFNLPKNLRIIKLPKFGPKIYPFSFTVTSF